MKVLKGNMKQIHLLLANLEFIQQQKKEFKQQQRKNTKSQKWNNLDACLLLDVGRLTSKPIVISIQETRAELLINIIKCNSI